MVLNWGRKGNYSYACARVKAKKSLLLTRDNYPKLLMMDLNEIGRFLGETQYQNEMAELASRYSGVNLIELGTSRNLARMNSNVLGFCTGELKEMIEAYLFRWDFWNIKTILRGKFYGATAEAIQEDLVPAGKLTEEYLNSLIAMESNVEILEAVRRKEGLSIPDDVMTIFEESGSLQSIEDFLDKIYYTRLFEKIKPTSKPMKLFLSFMRREIDVTNVRTLLKLKRAKIPAERMCDLFIGGGEELSINELTRLAGVDTFEQMVDEFSKFSFFENISEGLEEAKKGDSLTTVMRELQRHLMRQSERFSHIYPLSVLPVLDYLIRKKIEVENIRIIARGKESGMDSEVIKSLLVI
jgi:V/A-type H+-transporting ATPase subunit C